MGDDCSSKLPFLGTVDSVIYSRPPSENNLDNLFSNCLKASALVDS